RDVESQQPPGLARIVAGGEYQVLGADVALPCAYPPLAARDALERARLGVLVDLRARVARALAQRHGEIGGRDVTVVRVIERAEDGGSVRAARSEERR